MKEQAESGQHEINVDDSSDSGIATVQRTVNRTKRVLKNAGQGPARKRLRKSQSTQQPTHEHSDEDLVKDLEDIAPQVAEQLGTVDDESEEVTQGTALQDLTGEEICSNDLPELSLQVKWTSTTGRTKLSQLPLNLMASCDDVTGLHKRLVTRVFSESERPASLTCSDYLQFNTCEEVLNYPMDVSRTVFRVLASHDGWQYCVHETSGHPEARGAGSFLHVVSIEFETVARVIGHLGIRMSMIAYPIVAIHKGKLAQAIQKMRTDPDFKGIL